MAKATKPKAADKPVKEEKKLAVIPPAGYEHESGAEEQPEGTPAGYAGDADDDE